MTDTHPNQADGGGKGAPTPQGHEGPGESGGGAYKRDDTGTGDNREVERPVKTGGRPD